MKTIFETTDGNMRIDSRTFSGVKIEEQHTTKGFTYTGETTQWITHGRKYPGYVSIGYHVLVLIYGEWFRIKYFSAEPEIVPDEYRPSDKELGEAKAMAQLWIYENLPEMR